MNDIYTLIHSVYCKCKINSFPFDCVKILNNYGYKVYSYSELQAISQELYDMSKSYSNDAFVFKERNLIAYNDEMPKARIRFSLMHELGHILLKHDYSSLQQEDEADYFATHILAPRIMIHQLCLTSPSIKVTADDIHEFFGISITASNRALRDYHAWFYRLAHSTRKPTDEELAIRGLFL